MYYNIEVVFQIINQAIHPNNKIVIDENKVDWDIVYRIAQKHKALAYTYEIILKLADTYAISGQVMHQWKQEAVVTSVAELSKMQFARQLLEAAKEKGITMVVFKGYVLGELYPQPTYRKTSDMDILIYQEDKEAAIQLMQELGYTKDTSKSKEQVPVFVHVQKNHLIEMHFRLWEDFEGSNIDKLSDLAWVKRDSLLLVNCCDMEFLTLGYRQHLEYQMFHVIKHFSVAGTGIKHLVDITLFIEHYLDKIDLNSFWKNMDNMGYTTFCEKFFEICIHYLGMDDVILKGRSRTGKNDLDEIVIEFINAGQISKNQSGDYQVLGIMTPYFVGERSVATSKNTRMLRVLFPRADDMREEFNYAKKHKLLLPVAWIHRLVDFIVYRTKHKGASYTVSKKLNVTEHRITMMQKMGLIKEEDS